jgi:hypothetical protein
VYVNSSSYIRFTATNVWNSNSSFYEPYAFSGTLCLAASTTLVFGFQGGATSNGFGVSSSNKLYLHIFRIST